MKKFDKWQIGALFAIIMPIIGFFFYWEWRFEGWSWERLYGFMKSSSDNRNNILIFPLVPNLIMFYFSNFQFRMDKFTQGLVGVTIILAIPVVISLVI